MHTKMDPKKPTKKRDVVYISILLTITLCIGAYLILTTVFIAKDGVTFIEYAQNLRSNPTDTVLNQDQHPGYPFLILTAHKIAEKFTDGSSVESWIYSAQIVTLIFRLLTIVVLYLFGRELVGQKLSFCAVLILILLPRPAEYGSDALSDWPHLFFLATGLLLLMYAALKEKWWLLSFVGLSAGIGYLIRPECAQLLVYAACWLLIKIFKEKPANKKVKLATVFILLIVGFAISVIPYMNFKGALFPKKHVGVFSEQTIKEKPLAIDLKSFATASYQAAGRLINNVLETIMYVFIPALLVGIYHHFRKEKPDNFEKFFITAFVLLNLVMLTWLYAKAGYISKRHSFPLIAFTIFYIPVGLYAIGAWITKNYFAEKVQKNPTNQFWFLALFIIGISIYIPKLVTPMRTEKQNLYDLAQWLAKNTEKDDIIAVHDPRISFYAQRKGLKFETEQIPQQAKYIVKVFKKKNNEPALANQSVKTVYKQFAGKNGKTNVIVYRKF